MPALRGFRQKFHWQLSRILTDINKVKPKEKSTAELSVADVSKTEQFNDSSLNITLQNVSKSREVFMH